MIASVTYNTSGSAGPYTITFPYLAQTDVKVFLDGVANTAFTIASTTQLTLNTAPSATKIEIRRQTQVAPYVDFTAPGGISAANLDTATLQSIYIAQEAEDVATNRLPLNTALTAWDAGSKRITNVANPSAAQDAATKAYIDAIQIATGNVPTPGNPTDDGKFLKANAGLFSWQEVTSTPFGKAVLTATKPADAGLADALHVHPPDNRPIPAARVLFNPITTQVFGG